MSKRISLNCDMAEGFGAYTMGNDHALLKIVTTANIACGFHAGDPVIMRNCVQMARNAGVSIGAHPGFYDVQGFGRRPILMSASEVEYSVAYQIGALQALACYARLPVTHVKPHGALANMAAKDENYAMAIGRAIRTIDKNLIFMALYGSELHKASERLGLRVAREGYADRQYDEEGYLMPRSAVNAVIDEPEEALRQCLDMVQLGKVRTVTGKKLRVEIDTICIHGDQPMAVQVGERVKQGLEQEKIELISLDKMSL